ncbi:MAG: zinc ribbon domain-containing protein [Planctomycetota bacterium]
MARSMPLYHYRCSGCGHVFEQLVHTQDGAVVTAVQCPKCAGDRHERQPTTFAIGKQDRSAAEPFCGRCGENRPPCGA